MSLREIFFGKDGKLNSRREFYFLVGFLCWLTMFIVETWIAISTKTNYRWEITAAVFGMFGVLHYLRRRIDKKDE